MEAVESCDVVAGDADAEDAGERVGAARVGLGLSTISSVEFSSRIVEVAAFSFSCGQLIAALLLLVISMEGGARSEAKMDMQRVDLPTPDLSPATKSKRGGFIFE